MQGARMKNGLRIWLRPGERIYVNGAVLRADRKVSIEFLNDVTFLLESHVLLAEDTTTPLRQLYFIVQTILIDPEAAPMARQLYEQTHRLLLASFSNAEILAGLSDVNDLMTVGKTFDALKVIRALFSVEATILPDQGLSSLPDIPMQKVAS